ncbi:MAG: glycosyltransferase [Pseudomonadales bacterium]
MSEPDGFGRGVLLLTTDRQIDRRILLGADSLRRLGWHATIVAMPLDTPYEEDPQIQRIGPAGTAVTRESLVVHCYRLLRRLLGTNRGPIRSLKSLTWRFLVNPERFYERLFWPSIADRKCDVIVANDLPMLPVAAKLAEQSGARLVYDSHELYSEQEFSEREKERWSRIEAKYIHRCSAVITVNESIASELTRRYDVAPVHVILNAERSSNPPTRSAYFHDRYGLPETTGVLLFQGGMTSGRNIETLVRSMSMVNSDIALVLMGDGELSSSLESLVKRLQLQDRVYLHPAVPQSDLLARTAAASAGVIPYLATCLNNYYCTPNKLFEFIAAGVPILASELPELSKFVNGWEIGLVGDTSTPEHTAHLIDQFFADDKRLETFRHNVESARLEINWETEEKKLINIFDSLP